MRRLVEAHYFQNQDKPTTAQVRFFLRELRTPELLIECAGRWPSACRMQQRHRGLLTQALRGNQAGVESALNDEEWAERRADARYWAPLKAELENLRHARLTGAAKA